MTDYLTPTLLHLTEIELFFETGYSPSDRKISEVDEKSLAQDWEVVGRDFPIFPDNKFYWSEKL